MGVLQVCFALIFVSAAESARVVRKSDAVNAAGSLMSSVGAGDQFRSDDSVVEIDSSRDESRSSSTGSRRRRRSRRRSSGGSDGTSDSIITRRSPDGVRVAWVAQANLVDSKTDEVKLSTDASSEDYELMYLGVSTGDRRTDVPQDGDRMEDQGFQLIGVKGDDDKKVELWIRKNEGRGAISVCRPCGVWGEGKDKGGLGCGWGVISLKGVSLDLRSIETETGSRDHSDTLKIPQATSRTGLNILAIFFDDSVEIRGADNGDLALNKWGFGDGDGSALIVWQPGKTPPSSISVKAHDGGGRQTVSVMANIQLQ